MKKKNSTNKINKEKTVDKKTNYQLIISIIAIFASTTVGVFGIINSNTIAKLNKEIPTPILEYDIGQIFSGSFYFEVKNKGEVAALNVIIKLSPNIQYDITNCISVSPYQDIQPQTPEPILDNEEIYDSEKIYDTSTTYEVISIPPGGSFNFNCDIYYTKYIEPTTNPLTFLLSQYFIPVGEPPGPNCSGVSKIRVEDVLTWKLEEVSIVDTLDIDITSENSFPPETIEELPVVSVWHPDKIKEGSTSYGIMYCEAPK